MALLADIEPGKKFGQLTVIERVEPNKRGIARFKLQCDCGNMTTLVIGRIGVTQSCGCLVVKRRTKHGLAKSPTWGTWKTMMRRCHKEGSPGYEKYGGAGIHVCERWHTFTNFVEDMGVRPEGKTLDRKDNSKGYSPDNCRWATPKEQARNRRDNRLLTYKGETKCLTDWMAEASVPGRAFRGRINYGWCMECALTLPAYGRCKHKKKKPT